MKKSGSKLFVEALKKEGVEVLFGYPGGSVIPIFDELYLEPSIHLVLTRHEQAAVHAADGYARSTGKTGVCIVTSGPGATNTITGLATANFDSVPIVLFTGQVTRPMIGNDAFQEADMVGISRPVTKHNYLVNDRAHLGKIIKEAFYIASTGRPGPVVIDLPKDVVQESLDDEYPETVSIRGYNPVTVGHSGQIKRVASAIKKSKKPIFYIGGGMIIAGASDIFRSILEKTKIPTISSLMGIGTIPSDHPLYLGMVGMHGTYVSNMAVTECDLIVGLGTRFDDRVTGKLSEFAPHAEIIHIDIDPGAIARNVPVKIPIVGDVKQILEELYPLVEAPEINEWRTKIVKMKKEYPLPPGEETENPAPQQIVKVISDVFPDAIITTEVGQNQMFGALYYNYTKPRSFITSGGLGTMGYGFPAAIGAQLGNPDKKVIDIAGDGSIQMNIQELATAVQEGLPVIVAILNNGYLGMVRQWQQIFKDSRYAATCLMRKPSCPLQCKGKSGEWCHLYTVDFVKLAEAYGAIGMRIEKLKDVEPALKEAGKSKNVPVFIDFIIQRESNVFPMVPPGVGINKMILKEGEW
ncbi:MAG: biosynthetic-type acetolactate synthase large subunit [Spirochaetales bacterium]|nr:biosynthetic-type acetolactate synthase large subunit [Spirochaetales bacterium]